MENVKIEIYHEDGYDKCVYMGNDLEVIREVFNTHIMFEVELWDKEYSHSNDYKYTCIVFMNNQD